MLAFLGLHCTLATEYKHECNSLEVYSSDFAELLPEHFQEFQKLTELDTVVFKEGGTITTLGESAFQAFPSLTTVTFEEGCLISTILPHNFDNCPMLKSLDFSPLKNLTSIIDSVHNDPGLKEIIFAPELSNIDTSFYYLTSLETIVGNKYFIVEDSCLYSADKTTICIIPGQHTGCVTYPQNNNATRGTLFTEVKFSDPELSFIRYRRFYLQTNLKKVTIPDTVKSIESSAFEGCSHLDTIIWSSNIETIAENAFKQTAISEFTCPPNVKYIENSAFQDCVHLTKVSFTSDSIKTIASSAFQGCTKLTEITFSKSIESFGSLCFAYCSSLMFVTFDSSSLFDTIPDGMFLNCWSLDTVSLPDSVKYIGSEAFSHSNLKYLICQNVESIGGDAFFETPLVSFSLTKNMKRFSVSPFTNNFNLESFDGSSEEMETIDGVLFSKDLKELIQFPIGSQLTSFTIPEKTEIISDRAFADAIKLESISFGKKVTKIGDEAFSSTSLQTIVIPKSVNKLGNNVFFHSYVREISFETDSALTSLPPLGANFLVKINLPLSVTELEDSAFQNCESLKFVTFPSVTTIGKNCFTRCISLERVTLPKSLISIGENAFSSCSYLSSVLVEEGNQHFHTEAGGALVMDNNNIVLFPPAKKVEEYVANYEFIEENAFLNSNIKKVDLAKVTTLGDRSFAESIYLVEVNFPTMIVKIPNGCFEGCVSLERVNFPSGSKLTTIEQNAFDNCESLANLTLPASVESIAFGNWPAMENINVAVSSEKFASLYGILYNDENEFLYFPPAKKMTEYHVQSEFAREGAFAGQQYLKKVTIDSEIIPKSTFQRCTNLEEVVLSKNVKSIQSYAFSGCSKLEKVTIPSDSLLESFENCFQGCAFPSLFIPSNLKTITDGTFTGCTKLESFTISDDHLVFAVDKNGALIDQTTGTIVKVPALISNEHLTFDSTITQLNADAMIGLEYVKTVDLIETSITTLNSISRCPSIEKVTIPPDCTIGSRGLLMNPLLKTVTFAPTDGTIHHLTYLIKDYSIIRSFNGVEKVAFGSKVSTRSFFSCMSSDLTFDSVIKIDSSAFAASKELKSVTFHTAVTNVGDDAFSGCTKLEKVTINEGVIYGTGTFCDTSIKSIDNTISHIPRELFQGCKYLEKVNLSQMMSIRVIGANAFSKCSSLKMIVLPKTVAKISSEAFAGCTFLETINIPSYTLIEDSAFRHCDSLGTIKLDLCNLFMRQEEPFLDSSALYKINGQFGTIDDLGVVYFAGMLTLFPPGLTSQPEYTVKSDSKSIRTIRAAKNLSVLKFTSDSQMTVWYPESLRDLNKLRHLYIPPKLEAIGADCLYGVDVEELTVLGLQNENILAPFKEMKNLKKVHIAKGVEIDFSSFVNHDSMTVDYLDYDSQFPIWAIGLIVGGGVILIAVIIFVIILLLKKRKSNPLASSSGFVEFKA